MQSGSSFVNGDAVEDAVAVDVIAVVSSLGVIAALHLALLLAASPCDADSPRTWIEISVFSQCTEPPWGKSETGVRPFFSKHDVRVYGFRKEGRTVCSACSCPSTEKQLIRVREADVARVRQLLADAPNTSRVPAQR